MNKRQAKKRFKPEINHLNLMVRIIDNKEAYVSAFHYWDLFLLTYYSMKEIFRKGAWRYLCTDHYDKVCRVGNEYESIQNELLDEETETEFQKFLRSMYGAE